MTSVDVDFRPLRGSDFATLSRWLSQPLVAWWWADDASLEAIEAEYGPAVRGEEDREVFVVVLGGADAGLIQRYYWDDEPEWIDAVAPYAELPPRAMSIDYLLADEAPRGQGRGTAMIAAFVERLWREHPACPAVVVPVHAENRASWRALERCGFRRVAECELEPDNPEHSRDHVVYRLDRPARAGG